VPEFDSGNSQSIFLANIHLLCTISSIIHKQKPKGFAMRTNIEIDDKLMKDALRVTGAKTKKEAVEIGLKTVVSLERQAQVKLLRGKIHWEGNLDEMRRD
jgi:Arc/MetJ family transcription regulator